MEKPVHKTLLPIQLAFIVLFVIAFISSFFVVEPLKEQSRVSVTEKVVSSVSSKVAIAEELLNSKAASKYLADYQIEAIRDEINQFKNDPYDYVEAMTLDDSKSHITLPEASNSNPLKNMLVKKIFSWKTSIKAYFENTFDGLIFDIRAFLVSNLIALTIGAFISYNNQLLGKETIIVNTILTSVVILSSLLYINQDWFFTILLNRYNGYGYLFIVLIMTTWLYYHSWIIPRKEKA